MFCASLSPQRSSYRTTPSVAHSLSMEISGAFPVPENYDMIQRDSMANLNINGFLSCVIPVGGYESNPYSSSMSNNSTSTSDEGDDQNQKLGIIMDERKRRRMISNRESARRSRMRKQKHLDELWSLVVRLRTENHSLVEKLNHLTESQQQLLQENVKLKEEASDFCQMLTELQMGSPYTPHLRELGEVPCNTFDLIAESSSQSK